MQADRVTIIGAGHVGATAAYALMLRGLFSDIVLVDSDPALAQAEAADLSDANAFVRPVHVRAGTSADAASAAIAIVTAGAATHGDETRLSVAARSAVIVERCVGELVEAGFAGIFVIAANPVDLMTQVTLDVSGFPPARVVGTGTLLDSARLRQALASALDVAPISIDAMVIGEHGDSEVPLFASARVGGLPLDAFDTPDLAALAAGVRDAGYRIVSGKGYTSFAIANAIVRICEAIVRDERAILPVSISVADRFERRALCLSLPCIVGRGGIERVIDPALSPAETLALDVSATIVADALAKLPSRDRARAAA